MPLVPALARLSLGAPVLVPAPARVAARALTTSSPAAAAPPSRQRSSSRPRREKQSSAPLRVYPVFDEWVESPDAERYRYPKGRGPHWLGRTPFPMNPAFNPPPPVAARTRAEMWDKHHKDPVTCSIRGLAYMYNLPLDRVTAILRLKALEQEMKFENQPLQTEFEKGMEYSLGAVDKRPQHKVEQQLKQAHEPQKLEVEVLEESTDPPRIKAPVFENHPDDGSLESVLGPAMKRATKQSRQQRADLPSWGPDLATEANERLFRSAHPDRYAINFKDFGGDSYLMAGESVRAMRHQIHNMNFKKERARTLKLYNAEPQYDEQGNEIVPVTAADGIPRAGDRGWTVLQRKFEAAKKVRKSKLLVRYERKSHRLTVDRRHRAKWAALRLTGRLNRHFRWRFGDHVTKEGFDLAKALPDHLDRMLILKALNGAPEVREDAIKQLAEAKPLLDKAIKEHETRLTARKERRAKALPHSSPEEPKEASEST